MDKKQLINQNVPTILQLQLIFSQQKTYDYYTSFGRSILEASELTVLAISVAFYFLIVEIVFEILTAFSIEIGILRSHFVLNQSG